MLDALNSLSLSIMDPLLGWMLHLPRDVVLIIVAVGTALILTVVRLVTTNQGLLRRCQKDKGRLKELIREAKRSGDKEAVGRYRVTMREIGTVSFRAEGKPLLASVVPIALLAIWCFSRIGGMPLRPEEPVTVKAYFPISAIGRLVHMLPQDGLQAQNGWIQRIDQDIDPATETVPNGVAEWLIRCAARDEPYTLTIRYAGETYARDLLVDGLRYAQPCVFLDDKVTAIEVLTAEYKPFGIVPGIAAVGFPPWLVGYLLIVLPFSFALKPVLGIR